MNRTIKYFLTLLLMVVAAAGGARSVEAQNSNARPDGYVNLRSLGDLDRFFPRDAVMEVNVEGILMRMVEEASRQEDPELADLLAQLDGVYVLGYGLAGYDIDDFDELATGMGDELIDEGWTVIVRYRELTENTHMFAKLAGDGVAGMVVMSVEDGSDQAIFVNIVGDIDPGQIGKIGQKFQIGGMSDL